MFFIKVSHINHKLKKLQFIPKTSKVFNIKSLIRNSVPLLGFLHNRGVDLYTIGEIGGVDLYTIGSFFRIKNLKISIIFKQFQKK